MEFGPAHSLVCMLHAGQPLTELHELACFSFKGGICRAQHSRVLVLVLSIEPMVQDVIVLLEQLIQLACATKSACATESGSIWLSWTVLKICPQSCWALDPLLTDVAYSSHGMICSQSRSCPQPAEQRSLFVFPSQSIAPILPTSATRFENGGQNRPGARPETDKERTTSLEKYEQRRRGRGKTPWFTWIEPSPSRSTNFHVSFT